MLRPLLSSVFVLVSLSACSLPTAPTQQGQYGGGYLVTSSRSIQFADTGVHRDYKAWMASIASVYVSDTRDREPGFLPSKIDQCYRINYAAANRAEALRSCLILDYTGYKDAQNEAHRRGREPVGYFSMDAAGERWKRYGPPSGMSDPDSMIGYMRDAYRFVEPDVINLRHYERAYLAQH